MQGRGSVLSGHHGLGQGLFRASEGRTRLAGLQNEQVFTGGGGGRPQQLQLGEMRSPELGPEAKPRTQAARREPVRRQHAASRVPTDGRKQN